MTALAWLLAFGAGFLSLSQEILWVRFVGFVQHGVPQAFSLVLGLYLLGIALGAAAGKRLCHVARDLPRAAGGVLLAAGALDLALPALLERLAVADPAIRFLAVAALIVVTAALKAVLFPVAHHLGTDARGPALGRSLARAYFLNIVGSTLGPLLTGFVLLDVVTMEAGFRLIGWACLAMAAVAFVPARPLGAAAGAAAMVLAIVVVDPRAHGVVAAYAERPDGAAVKAVVSNRHGVIHVADGGADGDIVYGGNVYDGRTNVDLAINSNRIDRTYLLAMLHPQPERVLVIGLSTGAWLRVLSALPTVREIDVVEINPGYRELIRTYPDLAPLLADPRIRIHIDDGRRWLRRHDDARFDLVVMNTTFHWRANATNLLSQQFMTLASQRLAPGGVFAFNATGSDDALATAAAVFPHAYRWSNFVYAARHDFRAAKDRPEALARLAALAVDGRPLVPLAQPAYRAAAARLQAEAFVDRERVETKAGRRLEVIDDLAMQTEFRYGRGIAIQ